MPPNLLRIFSIVLIKVALVCGSKIPCHDVEIDCDWISLRGDCDIPQVKDVRIKNIVTFNDILIEFQFLIILAKLL